MEITEVRIKLMESAEDRLRGFCSITFDDCFVVRDLKIIEGNNGPFVAMPSRKLTSHCDKCRTKNHLRARFCNQCGNRLRNEEIAYDQDGRAKLYADIAHPVNAECREMIQKRVIEELEKEIELSSQPGYSSRYDDDYDVIQRHRQKASRSSDHKIDKRIDPGPSLDSPQPAPHRPQDTSEKAERPDSSGEAFGQGIFD